MRQFGTGIIISTAIVHVSVAPMSAFLEMSADDLTVVHACRVVLRQRVLERFELRSHHGRYTHGRTLLDLLDRVHRTSSLCS